MWGAILHTIITTTGLMIIIGSCVYMFDFSSLVTSSPTKTIASNSLDTTDYFYNEVVFRL